MPTLMCGARIVLYPRASKAVIAAALVMGAACALVAPCHASPVPAIEGAFGTIAYGWQADQKPIAAVPTHRYMIEFPPVGPDGSGVTTADFDQRMAALVKLDPEAKVLVEVVVGRMPEAYKANPDDVSRGDAKWAQPKFGPPPAVGSMAWRVAAARDVGERVAGAEAATWSAHVVAYLVADETEFLSGRPPADYSKATARAFREFVRAKYHTLADLRAAWGQARHPVSDIEKAPSSEPRPIMSWDEVKVPAPDRIVRPPQDLLEPPAFTDVVDYRQFEWKMAADTALALAAAAKAKSNGKPVGTSYPNQVAVGSGASTSGEALGLGRVLGEPDVDFLLLGSGLYAARPGSHAISDPHGPDGATAEDDPAAVAKRDDELKAQKERGAQPVQLAVVVDVNSAAYTPHLGPFVADQLGEIEKAGIPYRVYQLQDLVEREFPKERVIMFLNAFVLDEKQRQILATLRSGGRTLIFVYAAGAMRPDRGVDGRDMRDFTGIAITMLPKDRPLRITVTGGLAPWTSELGEGVVYGPKQTLRPGFCVVDEQADVLGTIVGLKMPGLVAKKFEGWTSIYSAAPGIPAAVLKGLVSAR